MSPAPVLHVDADAFFASVEQLDQPRLRGLPLLVGGVGGRGVVASASVEAKRLGARSAMPMSVAQRGLGPHHVVVTPRFERYREVSRAMMDALAQDAQLVQPVSIDEAYVALREGADARRAARAAVARVRAATGISVSVGGATTMVCAKMLSTWTKVVNGPASHAVLRDAAAERAWMAEQPVRALPGVGPRTAEALADLDVTTVGGIAGVDRALLERAVGVAAARALSSTARNDDPRRPSPPEARKQVSQERTWSHDVDDTHVLVERARVQAVEVVAALRDGGVAARTVSVKLRDADFTDVSRSRTLPHATDEEQVVADVAADLVGLAHAALDRRPVRLVGVAASNLADAAQPSLDLG